ncbi:NUDIX domain-containing protein [Kitasatospora sp. MAP5-34]|uniref:NUDIX domain-containing protein n=1 Tax=Kitasatospora sp. MAP5-34 TaxID=3035102 RepID=UPI00247582B2|nr:NUDIX domain-containing protein [Kitasatospora sp. MAP5-34]MDH6575411.1 8-oxo-dGTP pyrophosphatase MutT (NUDIX family) [Kitasatospora sp. MAP5-34]
MVPETVDFVDAEDRPAGRGPRGEAAGLGLYYRVAATVCGDREGRVLVYRRPARAAVFGGHYDVLIGGSVRAGESYRAAAARELDEELGVRPALHEVFRTRHDSPAGPCWLAVHRARLTGPVLPDPAEVAWYGLVPAQDVLDGLLHPFVPAGRQALVRLLG